MKICTIYAETDIMSRFWQFSQLSDAYKGHNPMDQIPHHGPGELLIGGLKVIDRPDDLAKRGITHIVSVLEYDHCDYEEYAKFQRLWIGIEDHPAQNLLRHFRRTNAFIDQALAGNGRVLVHCAMGVSRSATVVLAYLMWKQKAAFLHALLQVQQARPLCAPNVGFVEQLETYERMLKAESDEKRNMIYSEWLSKFAGEPKL